MKRVSPVGALLRGLVAGYAGSRGQDRFFRITAKITPATPHVWNPPELEQEHETATETLARRVVDSLMQRGPLEPQTKERAARIVHYAFGAGWGGLYGLLRESFPRLAKPLGVLAFSGAVWMASDNGLLPAFRLAASPKAYPLRTHAYAIAAHIAYGVTMALAYEALRPRSFVSVRSAFGAAPLASYVERRGRRLERRVVRSIERLVAEARS